MGRALPAWVPFPPLCPVSVWVPGAWACRGAAWRCLWEGGTYSLFGPVVRDGTVQGDAVAELCVVPVFLELAFRLLAVIPQGGCHAALAQASWPLHQTNGLGKTWWEKRGGQAGPRPYRDVPPLPSSQPRPDSPFLSDANTANSSHIAEFQL